MEYVTAAKAMGIREHTIVFRHILPNVVSLLIVSMTLDFATCMLTESTLSYLGFGIPLPTPTWGNLLNGANNSIVIQQYWWQLGVPGCDFRHLHHLHQPDRRRRCATRWTRRRSNDKKEGKNLWHCLKCKI